MRPAECLARWRTARVANSLFVPRPPGVPADDAISADLGDPRAGASV